MSPSRAKDALTQVATRAVDENCPGEINLLGIMVTMMDGSLLPDRIVPSDQDLSHRLQTYSFSCPS